MNVDWHSKEKEAAERRDIAKHPRCGTCWWWSATEEVRDGFIYPMMAGCENEPNIVDKAFSDRCSRWRNKNDGPPA